MNSESQPQFSTFDFFSNPKFQNYFENLYPTPTYTQLDRIKRKWYKNNIDLSFDIDSNKNPDQQTENMTFNQETSKKEETEERKNNFNNNSENKGSFIAEEGVKLPFFKNILFMLEAYLKFSFMVSFVGFRFFASYLGMVISILALYRQGKRPRFTRDYGAKIAFSEHFHNLLYFSIFMFYPDFANIIYFLPMMLHCWIGLCNYVFLKKGKIYVALKKHVDLTRVNEKNMLVFKQTLEIVLLVWLLIKLFFTLHYSVTLILIYGSYIRVKYHLNENMEKAFQKIDVWIRGYVFSERCPGIVGKIYDKFVDLCRYAVKLN